MSKASHFAWYNGNIVERERAAPSVASISFHMGTGVFDGFMAYWNGGHYYYHEAHAHLNRFKGGAAEVGLNFGWAAEQLLSGVEELLAREPKGTHYIRPIAYRSGPELWLTGAEGRPVDVCIFAVPVVRDVLSPIACHLSPIERISRSAMPTGVKICGNYVNSFMARKAAERDGFSDGIMLDRTGHIAEASAANVFFVDGEGLFTPRLNSDIFPGITRRIVCDLSSPLGIACREVPITVEDIAMAKGAFLCSTLMELRPISRLGTQALSTLDNDCFHRVIRAFQEMTHQ